MTMHLTMCCSEALAGGEGHRGACARRPLHSKRLVAPGG